MNQLFNRPLDQQVNTPSHSLPQSPNSFQGQRFYKKPPSKMRVKIFGVLAVVLILIALPVTVLLSRQQQKYQQSAHTPQPSITTACQGAGVVLTATYTITNVPSGVTCQVAATDSQNYLNDSFSITNDKTHTKTVNTNKATIQPGVVTYTTKCSDGFTKTNQVSYQQTKACIIPTPSPKPTATPTPTLTMTPSPTACITPGQVTNVQVSCPDCVSK